MWVVNGGISERGAYTHHAVMRSGHQYIHEIERKRDREREREGEWERGGEKSEIGREKKGVLKVTNKVFFTTFKEKNCWK